MLLQQSKMASGLIVTLLISCGFLCAGDGKSHPSDYPLWECTGGCEHAHIPSDQEYHKDDLLLAQESYRESAVWGLVALGVAAGGLWWYGRCCQEDALARSRSIDKPSDDGDTLPDEPLSGETNKHNRKNVIAIGSALVVCGAGLVALTHVVDGYHRASNK